MSEQIYFMDRDELHRLIVNARWFADYFVRSKEVSPGHFKVKTNYPWIQQSGRE